MDTLRKVLLHNAADIFEDMAREDKDTKSSVAMLSALNAVQACDASVSGARISRYDSSPELARAVILQIAGRIGKPHERPLIQILHAVLDATLQLADKLAVPAAQQAYFESNWQEVEAQRRLTIPVEGETTDPATTAEGRIGRSRHMLLTIVARELETLRAGARVLTEDEPPMTSEMLDSMMEVVKKAEFVLYDCHIPNENEEPEPSDQARLISSTPSDLMWPEELMRMELCAEQRVAMAAIMKQATREQLPTKSEDFVPSSLVARLLNCCARSLSVCSMYLVLLTKQLCATMHPVLDICDEYDKLGEQAFFDMTKPLYASAANAAANSTLAIFNGTYQTADLKTGSMIPVLETQALSVAAEIRTSESHTAMLQVCATVAALTRQRDAPVSRGGDALAATNWAIATALACTLPYVFQLDTKETHMFPAKEGTLSFLSGMTIRSGFAGGPAVSGMLLTFVCMRSQ